MSDPRTEPSLRTKKSETVLKAMTLLDRFLVEQRPLTLGDLAQATGIHKTTVFRLCNSLVATGLLQRSADATFFIGPKIWRLAQVFEQSIDAERLVRPILVELRDATGESASFYVRDGEWRVCVYRENARHAIRHHLEEGSRLPLREGVVGHVLLAFAGEPGGDYDRIRVDGHLIAQGREPYTASVAVPVFAADGGLVGALVVSGPSSRFDEAKRREALELARAAASSLREVVGDARQLFPAFPSARAASAAG
jgi:DNA-binding IclR family transcriptional regulator